MTRINASLTTISDELIRAELGEIGRVLFNVIKIIKEDKKLPPIPPKFTLNKGHMTFFYDKVDFIIERYLKLRDEYYMRYKKAYSHEHFNMIMDRYEYIYTYAPHLCNSWLPTYEADMMVRQRIYTLSGGYNNHHYYGEIITNWKKILTKDLVLTC